MKLGSLREKGCVMQDAEASIDTADGESGKFCDSCRERELDWLASHDR